MGDTRDSPAMAGVMVHALGGTHTTNPLGWRNRFMAGKSHPDHQAIQMACEKGLMRQRDDLSEIFPVSIYLVTDEGKAWLVANGWADDIEGAG